MEQFLGILKEFGVSTAFLIALLYALRQSGIWFAMNVAQPIVTAHIEFMKQSMAIQQKMGEALSRIESHTTEMHKILVKEE